MNEIGTFLFGWARDTLVGPISLASEAIFKVDNKPSCCFGRRKEFRLPPFFLIQPRFPHLYWTPLQASRGMQFAKDDWFH